MNISVPKGHSECPKKHLEFGIDRIPTVLHLLLYAKNERSTGNLESSEYVRCYEYCTALAVYGTDGVPSQQS